MFVGDGVPVHGAAVREALGARAFIAPENLRDLRADAACMLAAIRPETWVSPAALRPIYLRAPQAVRERERKLGMKRQESQVKVGMITLDGDFGV